MNCLSKISRTVTPTFSREDDFSFQKPSTNSTSSFTCRIPINYQRILQNVNYMLQSEIGHLKMNVLSCDN